MARFRGDEDIPDMRPLLLNREDENTDGYETFSHEARQSRDNNKTFRFMVLGCDDDLMNKACADILRLPQEENDRNIPACVVKEGEISGRQVSVLKTPSYWLEHLKSKVFFSNGVKSIRNEMEFCESQLFPGPHAFLLVLGDVKNSDKEHLLLRALKNVFGDDALDYTIVLFMRDNERRNILKNRCVKKCRERYYVLEDNENSVLNLFEDIEAMTQWKQNSYFTKHFELLQKAKKYFHTECEKCEEWKGKLETMKLTVKEKSNEITELQKKHSDDLHKVIYEFKVSENQLRKYLDDSQVRENQLRKDLDDLKVRENQLKADNKKLKREKVLVKEKEMCEIQRDVDKRKIELETREKESSPSSESEPERYSSTAVPPPADKARAADEGDKAEGRDEASQASGSDVTEGLKPVRRNSKELNPPFMSESEHGPPHNL